MWRQCDEMAPSLCPTCAQCIAIAQDRDHLCIFEFLMRLYPEFEAIRTQLLHRVTPPSLSDTLAFVIAENTSLCSLDAVPPVVAPHIVLATPQLPPQLPPQSASPLCPLLPPPYFGAPMSPTYQSSASTPSYAPPGSSAPQRRPPCCHYCHALGHVRAECRKLQSHQSSLLLY